MTAMTNELTAEQIADGWIEHDGGRQPLAGQRRVAVMFRNGLVRGLQWTRAGYVCKYRAKSIPWQHDLIGCNYPDLHIVAYKPEPRP